MNVQRDARATGLGLVLVVVGAVLAMFLAACGSPKFNTCLDAWKSNAAPLHRGDAGWNARLDRDGDGVACEDRPGSWPTATEVPLQ